jgi:DNA-binding NarL/FixJ family response regulator
MYWLCHGKSRAKIGEEMGLSEETIKHHLKRIFARLGVSNAIQAVVSYLDMAYYQGLHDQGDQSRPDATK